VDDVAKVDGFCSIRQRAPRETGLPPQLRPAALDQRLLMMPCAEAGQFVRIG
jgi:hypothetical protein